MNAVTKLLTDHMDVWTAAYTEKRSGRGRSATGSAYGIKKLRELILELAVRGKLVPQDPRDEPARDLLLRIGSQGKHDRKSSDLRVQAELDEQLFDIPSTWAWVNLPKVSSYKVGKTPSTKSNIYWTEHVDGINWVSIADLSDDGEVRETAKRVSCEAARDVFRNPPSPVGTILMSFKLTLGKISYLKIPAYHNEAIISIFPTSAIFDRYLFKVLPSRAKAGDTKSAIKGNTLNSESIAALKIPIPPLAEQHRIVAKVDELMALCDQLEAAQAGAAEAHENLVTQLLGTLTASKNAEDFAASWQRIATHFDTLFSTEVSIDALKQTILQLAVMGKLVPQDPNDEPSNELLKRIEFRKSRLIEDGIIKKDKTLRLIAEKEKPFPIPSTWVFTRLQTVLDVRDGTHDSPKEASGPDTYPLVTSKDFEDGMINFDTAKMISAADHFEISKRSFVEKFDILFSMIGGNIGNQVMVDDDRQFSVKNVALFKYYDRDVTVPKYIKKYTENLARTLQKSAIGGAQPFIGLGSLRDLVFALPPVNEQHRIVAKVDELMTLCDQLRAHLSQANRVQQTLADTLVIQAVA